MAKEWFTAQELEGLPGLPTTARRVLEMAKREGWKARKRDKGKGLEYHLSALPEATRAHLLRQSVAALPVKTKAAPAKREAAPVAALTSKQRDVMNARLGVLSLIDEIAATHNLSTRQAIGALLDAAKAGTLTAEQMRTLHRAHACQGKKQSAKLPCRATLYNWMVARRDGVADLAPAQGRPVEAQPAWFAPFLHVYQREMPNSYVTECWRAFPSFFPAVQLAALRTVQTRLKAMPVEMREWGRKGRNALRAVQPFVRRTTDGLWPMDVVTVDGHLFKAYVKNPMDSRLKIRPEVTCYLDVATRKVVGFSAWLAESGVAIWAALRDMVINPEVGTPACHYSDNGAYRSEAHRALMGRVGAQMMFSQAYRAQSRGMIERLNSSLWIPLARTFATYVNDDADEERTRKALKIANKTGDNLPAWEDFLTQCREAIDRYNNTPHSSINNQSPNQAWAAAVAEGWQPTLLEGDGLWDILMQGSRKVARGEVRLPWGRYFSEELSAYHGRTVRVAYHPTRGEAVGVLDEDGRLICVAHRDGNVRDYVPASYLSHARAERAKAAIGRKERQIEEYRAEAASAYLPHLEASPGDANKVASLGHAPARVEQDDEQDAFELNFHSSIEAMHQQVFGNSLDMPSQASGQ